MITAERVERKGDGTEFYFKGLSSDTKPTGTYGDNDEKIKNGSIFMEMNTKTVKYYDEANETWV